MATQSEVIAALQAQVSSLTAEIAFFDGILSAADALPASSGLTQVKNYASGQKSRRSADKDAINNLINWLNAYTMTPEELSLLAALIAASTFPPYMPEIPVFEEL